MAADKQVDKYKDVLEKISKKFSQNPSGSSSLSTSSLTSSTSLTNSITAEQDQASLEKRCKKIHEYRLAQAMDESIKELPDGLLRNVLENCSKLEKSIAGEIIKSEINVENDVTKKLATIMENHVSAIQKQKRLVNKLLQDNESAKHKYQVIIWNYYQKPTNPHPPNNFIFFKNKTIIQKLGCTSS